MLQPHGHFGGRLAPVPDMELQHVNVKLPLAPLDEPVDIFLGRLIPVFHTWIREQRPTDLLIDIADYRHVPDGPGVLIIGHSGSISVDNTDGRLGVRYNAKTPLECTNQDRLRQAARSALEACRRLEGEPQLGGKLRFAGREVAIFFNDRLLSPNLDTTREAARPEIENLRTQALRKARPFSFSWVTDPRRLLTATLTVTRPFSASDLLANLNV